MWYAIRQIFLKGGDIKDAIHYIFKKTGNMPTKSEGMKIINVYQDVQKHSGKVIQFPKDRITDPFKPRPGEASPLFKDSPEAIAKIKAENKAAAERLRKKKEAEELFTDERPPKDPDFASGGIARVGMFAGGPLQKGAAWVIKNLRKSRQEIIEGKGQFSKLNPMQQDELKGELSALIKQLERGGAIPDDILQTMRQDKRFKDVVKNPSTDPELRELEEVLLGKTDMDRMRDIEQKITLDEFDVTGRKKNASGGIAGPLHLYDGGRANYDKGGMSRRKFLQLFGGLASVPLLGKYFKWAKPAAKAVSPAAEVVARGADGIPTYAWDLINVVKAKGTKEIMEGLYKRFPTQKKYTYKGVEVTEDGLGNVAVKKEQTKTGHWTDEATDDTIVDDYVDREIGFEIKQGEIVKGKDGKPLKAGDEYNESTAHMQGDPEGGMDVDILEEVISDADHLDLKKIADESLIKKAEGGRASYTKGGLAKILGV